MVSRVVLILGPSPTSSQTYRQYQPPSLKSNLACVPLSANLEELVERGQGFSAIALAKPDEDLDSGTFKR